MRGDSELRTRRSRVQRLQRQSAVFDVRRAVRLSMGTPSGNPYASRRVRNTSVPSRVVYAVADFSAPAPEDQIQRTAAALRAHNIETVLVDTAADAKREVLARIPDGSEVHSGASKTLQEIGIIADLEASGRIDWLRTRTGKMDRATQAREIRKLAAAPDVMLGSVAAVTEDGKLLAASNSGSQLGPYAASAGKLILVVGAQKIVSSVDEALRRIYDHALALESERLRAAIGVDSNVSYVLIVSRDPRPGRTTVVIVREALGF